MPKVKKTGQAPKVKLPSTVCQEEQYPHISFRYMTTNRNFSLKAVEALDTTDRLLTLRGTCDLTRERLLFFLTFVNSMLVRDSILPDFRDDIVLDENRLNSILERCYGVVLSNEKDTLAMRILQIQHENPSQNDIVRRKIDYSLYDLTQDVLERDDLADKKPMGPTTTNTYGGKLQKDIAGKPET